MVERIFNYSVTKCSSGISAFVPHLSFRAFVLCILLLRINRSIRLFISNSPQFERTLREQNRKREG